MRKQRIEAVHLRVRDGAKCGHKYAKRFTTNILEITCQQCGGPKGGLLHRDDRQVGCTLKVHLNRQTIILDVLSRQHAHCLAIAFAQCCKVDFLWCEYNEITRGDRGKYIERRDWTKKMLDLCCVHSHEKTEHDEKLVRTAYHGAKVEIIKMTEVKS